MDLYIYCVGVKSGIMSTPIPRWKNERETRVREIVIGARDPSRPGKDERYIKHRTHTPNRVGLLDLGRRGGRLCTTDRGPQYLPLIRYQDGYHGVNLARCRLWINNYRKNKIFTYFRHVLGLEFSCYIKGEVFL